MDLVNKAIRNEIKGAIIKTVAFFDLFDYPLALIEVHKYLFLPGLAGEKLELSEMAECLDELIYSGQNLNRLESLNGFYFLTGRGAIISKRLARNNYTDKKIRRAKKIIRLFAFLPWIRLAAIGNVIGSRNLKYESDIDLFIVTKKNRIWLTRFFTTLITAILDLRPKEGETRDKICLSFFVSEDRLNLKHLAYDNDIYFYYWLAGLIPIYVRGGIYRKLLEANHWVKEGLPNYAPTEPISNTVLEPWLIQVLIGKILELLLGWLENPLRSFQTRFFPSAIKEKLNKGFEVMADKGLIKLHVNDRRKYYLESWKKFHEI